VFTVSAHALTIAASLTAVTIHLVRGVMSGPSPPGDRFAPVPGSGEAVVPGVAVANPRVTPSCMRVL
jgi:hypothetical protein